PAGGPRTLSTARAVRHRISAAPAVAAQRGPGHCRPDKRPGYGRRAVRRRTANGGSTVSIALITLGGTIAMGGVDAGRSGVVTRLTGADLTAAVPGLADLGVPVDVRDTHAVPSAHLTARQLLAVVDEASRAVSAGATGVVVTQGTDTLEETAFLADLIWPHAAPLVFTGAMRNPTLACADGPANLLAALRVAAAPDTRDL